MTHNNKNYKWCTSFNNGQGAWVFRWKDGCEEYKNKQGKKPSVYFYNPATNAVIYCSWVVPAPDQKDYLVAITITG